MNIKKLFKRIFRTSYRLSVTTKGITRHTYGYDRRMLVNMGKNSPADSDWAVFKKGPLKMPERMVYHGLVTGNTENNIKQ